MFDYQAKTWGSSKVRLSPKYLQYLKLKYLLEDLKEVKGKVLDVGCGGGNIARAIAFYRPDLEIFASDISPEAIKRAKKQPERVEFLVADAGKLPFPKGTLAAVTMFDLLEHLKEAEKAVAEAFRVLRPGGRFIVFAPLEGQPLTLYWWLSKLGWQGKEKHCGHLQRFSFSRLGQMIEKRGFVVTGASFSFHCLGQLLDIGFDLVLAGKLKTGLEEHLGKEGKRFWRFWKDVLVTLANWESQIFSRLPAGGVQLTCVKP